MEENKILAYVRGNDVLFIVSVTTPEIDGEGKPIEDSYVPVDFTGWDDYSLRVVKQGVTRTIVAESSQLVEGEEGKIVVDVPYTALCGTYSLELVGRQNGRHERSYEIMMFAIVESNDKANLIYEVIDGYKSTDLDITVQMVSSALVYGENAYQMWKHLSGNEDKTLQDYIDEVLDLNGIAERANAAADSAEEAAETASHLPYIGADNYVYEWDKEEGEYYKTDVYVKGDPGTPADMSQLYTKAESDARYQQQIAGKGLSSNDYTTEEKAKLAGLHNYDDGPIIWLIQNLQSSLTNYYTKTETYSKTQVNNLIASVHGMEIVLVSVLPTASEETMGKIYLVPSASVAGSNIKDEYITIHEGSSYQWEVIGSTDVSLDGYVTDEDLQTALASYYQKPSGGIPSTDLSSAVQTSLGKADNAYQKPVSGIPASDLASGVIPDVSNFISKSQTAGLVKNDGTIDTTTYQSALTGQTAYTSKGTATKVPQITTNALGQVTGITEVTITQPDVSNLIAKSETAGLVKNDGTIDTSTYLTSHQDITGKEDKMAIDSTAKTASFTASVGNYYKVNIAASGSVTITLTTPSDNTHISNAVFLVTTSTSPALTFSAASGVDIYVSSSYSIEASKIYEINALWNGTNWSIAAVELEAQS